MGTKRLVLAAAAGVTAIGITTAGASTLNLAGPGSWFAGIAQQSNATTTSCVAGSQEVSLPVSDNTVSGARLQQQTLQGCAGQQVQVVLYKGSDMVRKSEIKRITANGLDVSLAFPSAINVQDFDKYRVTVASDIVN